MAKIEIDEDNMYDQYSNCRLADGTLIPVINIHYKNGPLDERAHEPTILVYFENEDGSLYVKDEDQINEQMYEPGKRRRD